jgi:hypothetical protein
MNICLDNQLPQFPLSFKRTKSRRRHVENGQEKKGVISADVGCRGALGKDDNRECGSHVAQIATEYRFCSTIIEVRDVLGEP